MKFVYSLIFFSCLYSQSLIEGRLLDSLHIKLIRIDFKADQNPLTTGTGKFDSDSNLYALDPSGSRNTIKYWQQHLEFTKNYLSAASKGNLKLGWEIWPQEDGKAYTLSNEIIHYNRTQKREDEKQAAFDSTRVLKYLEFVQDAIWLVDSTNADIFQTQSNTFYLILHAGSSRLIDGGSLGTQNVDTPGDFFDALVDKSSFNALSKHKDSARHKDSLGINTRNTLLEQVGVMAEHQSQDQLNWGSNGILLHILAQAIGLPLSYNIEQGSPMQGQFDLLDYAGAQTGKGFLPVLPAAWHRLYLGWDSLVVASPDSLGQNSYRLNPLSDSSYVLKIPINNQEYLLLENRSRLPLNDSVLTLKTFGNIQQTFPIDSLALALSDSICKPSCQKNTQQLKGVLESLSSYDIGLPGSGILVWHINEWAQDSVLGGNPINPWRTSTTRHHYPVMSLVEADGLSSLGVALSAAGGYDFGGANKIFPHIYKKDTIQNLLSSGWSSTQSIVSGANLLELSFLPNKTANEYSMHSLYGDSVQTFGGQSIEVNIDWGGLHIPGGNFPIPGELIGPVDSFWLAQDSLLHLQWFDSQGNILQSINHSKKITQYTQILDTLYLLAENQIYNYTIVSDTLVEISKNVSSAIQVWNYNNTLIQNERSQITWNNNPYSITEKIQAWCEIDDIDNDDINDFAVLDSENNIHTWSSVESNLTKIITGIEVSGQYQIACGDIDKNGSPNMVLVANNGKIINWDFGSDSFSSSPQSFDRNQNTPISLQDINNDGYIDIHFGGKKKFYALDHNLTPLDKYPISFPNVYQHLPFQEEWFPSSPISISTNDESFTLFASNMGRLHGYNQNGKAISNLNTLTTRSVNTGETFGNDLFPLNLTSPSNSIEPIIVNNSKNQIIAWQDGEQWQAYRFPTKIQNIWSKKGGSNKNNFYLNTALLQDPKKRNDEAFIDFVLYPAPLVQKKATPKIAIHGQASSAKIEIFSTQNNLVFEKSFQENYNDGNHILPEINLDKLGSGRYVVRMTLTMQSGKILKRFFRMTVIR